jgi:HK97 family phage major capsid protein
VTTTALPTTPAAWEEYVQGLDTPEKFTSAFNDGTFTKNLQAYVGTQTDSAAELQKTVQAEVQASIVELLKANGVKPDGDRINGGLNLSAKRPRHNKDGKGAALDGKFADLGEFVQTIWHKRLDGGWRPKHNAELNANLEILNAYQEKVPSDGGFIVPEEFRTEIMSVALESAIVRPRAQVIPMGTPSLSFPTVDASSNVSTVFGGIVVYRTEEGEEFVESQAKFARIKLDVTKQTALAYLTNEVIKDTRGALVAWLMQNLPAAMAWFEDLDYISGTGAGEPLGALNAANPALTVIAKRSGQAADTIVWENIIDMYARMLPQSLGSAVWMASPDVFGELATMALSVGTGGSAVWLTDAHGTPQLTLLGRPIVMTEKAPSVLGGQSDLSFVDFSKYLIGDREDLSIETSAHVKFTSDQTTIRAIQRNDGRPAILSAITPQNNGPSLSPFITLGERA